MKKAILITLLFLGLFGLISLPLLYPIAKTVRSEQHLARAIELKESGQDDWLAWVLIQAAYNLRPNNPEILSRMGSYGAEVFDPKTLGFWTEAAQRNLLDLEGTLDLIEYGLLTGRADAVKPYLYEVAREHPGNPRVQGLQVRLLRRDRRAGESRAMAQELVRSGNRELAVFSTYVETTLGDTGVSEAEQEEAFAALREAAVSADPVGIYALRVLLRLWDRLGEPDRADLEAALAAHPEARLSDRLLLLSLKKADGADPAAILAIGKALYAESAPPERDPFAEPAGDEADDGGPPVLTVFTDWLYREGYTEEVLAYLPEAEGVEDADAFFVRQMALIATGRAEAARDASFEENPLSPARNFVSRAMAQASLGEEDKVLPNLEQAVANVRVSEIAWLERVLQQVGQVDLILELYEDLERNLANPLPAQLRLLQYYYALGREIDVQRVVEDIDPDRLTGSLPDQLRVLYYFALYHPDQAAVRRHLEGLLSEFPRLIEPRVFLAFNYALSGETATARELITGVGDFQLEQSRPFAIMLAAIRLSEGDLETARELISGLPPETLLDKERVLLNALI